MATVQFKGNPVQTTGELPAKGTQAPDFALVRTNLGDLTLADLKGKKVVLNIFPSLDTAVCAASVRRFNAEASALDNTTVVCVSKDLPFAHNRFCTTEGLANVIPASEFRNNHFGQAYGVDFADGPLKGLMARAVVTLDENGKVLYSQFVPEVTEEPDYAAALASIK